MDPAALGTLIIGLDHVRDEQSNEPRRQRRESRRETQQHPFRVAVATALRALADRLERPATTQPASG